MENLIATSIIVFVFYAWLFVPKKTTVTVIEDKSNISTKTVIVSEPLPKSEFKKPSGVKKNKLNVTVPTEPSDADKEAIAHAVDMAKETDLDKLTIRQLKKLASVAKIKRYSTKTKAELIACLS